MSMKIAERCNIHPDTAPLPATAPLAKRMGERIADTARDVPRADERQEQEDSHVPAAAAIVPSQTFALPSLLLPTAAPMNPDPVPAVMDPTLPPAPVTRAGQQVEPAGTGTGASPSRADPRAAGKAVLLQPVQAQSAPADQPSSPVHRAATAAVPLPARPLAATQSVNAADAEGTMQGSLQQPAGSAPVEQDLQQAHAAPAELATRVDVSQAGGPVQPVAHVLASADVSGDLPGSRRHQQTPQQATRNTPQQARAIQHAQALQQGLAARAEVATRVDVSFRSWGPGHTVTARMDGARLQLQPSSQRVQHALSTARLPGEVALDLTVTDVIDDQHHDPREEHRS